MVGITSKIMIAEMRRQQQLSQSIVDGQTAISSGVSLTKPSQDVLAWVQLSEVGRAQAQQSAWQSNVSYGSARAGNAEANLSEMDNLLKRAQELVTSARNGSLNDTSRAALTEELSTIRTTVNELLNQKDYQGTPVFDDGQSVLVPVSRGLNLAVVGTKQEVSEGIDVNGTPMSIDDILAAMGGSRPAPAPAPPEEEEEEEEQPSTAPPPLDSAQRVAGPSGVDFRFRSGMLRIDPTQAAALSADCATIFAQQTGSNWLPATAAPRCALERLALAIFDKHTAGASFDAALVAAVTNCDVGQRNAALAEWTRLPEARQCHPREEHLLPLMVAAGAAAEGEPATRIWAGGYLGVALSAFRFGE